MLRFAIGLVVACAACPAIAAGSATHWPRYTETETLASIAPMGVWVDDTDARRVNLCR